jgi:tRNA acetyltransferase TAN1
MEFNFIATTFRFREDDLISELEDLFYMYGDTDVKISSSNISGIVMGYSSKDTLGFPAFLREKLRDTPWEVRYLLRFIPIEKVVPSDMENIRDLSKSLLERLETSDTVKILVEKRHTNLKSIDLINEIGPFIKAKVNLTNPEWLLVIEIVGKYAGISLVRHDMIFSSMIEKRNFD